MKSPTLRPQQTVTNAAQLPATLPALGPGGVGHGRASRPCNPVSARRARGLANASESHKSRLCRRRTRLSVPRRRPAKLPSLAPGCVGRGLTSARTKPAHTRRAWGLGTRQNHPRWRWWVVRADQAELTKLAGIATTSSAWEWCTINNELRTTSGRRVLGGRPRSSLGPCDSGCWASPAASPVGANGCRRCLGSQGRMPDGAYSFPTPSWSG